VQPPLDANNDYSYRTKRYTARVITYNSLNQPIAKGKTKYWKGKWKGKTKKFRASIEALM